MPDGKKIGTSKEANYTDKEIPHNETYTYTVKAYDESDNYSLESDIQTVTTGILKTVPIAAGDYHSLQIRSDGTVWACGYNYYGELGDGTKVKRIEAVQVKGLENIVAVSAGNSYSVALMNNGTVWTWGYGENRQLGNGTRNNSSTPVKVKGLNDVVAIKAGNSHTLA
ncbi:RCC1 domain-containing protein [Acetivibrio straminisolvens]|uniref:RCC1 domain-containing protein n=1 Tax=Acetivibrio straminisolvens TaxID=253314 RepID=UPI000B911AA8